jgi:hypothetical protein
MQLLAKSLVTAVNLPAELPLFAVLKLLAAADTCASCLALPVNVQPISSDKHLGLATHSDSRAHLILDICRFNNQLKKKPKILTSNVLM